MQEKFIETKLSEPANTAILEASKMSKKSVKVEQQQQQQQQLQAHEVHLKAPNSQQLNQQVSERLVLREPLKRRSSSGVARKRKGASDKRLKMAEFGEEEPADAAATPTADTCESGGENICAACARPIKERYLLMALDKQWHEDCLKCACCDCRLGEVGSSLFTHADKLLCRRDFLRIFGRAGHCAACKKSIPPYELVMRAQENAYHMDCFACQQCQYRFCVGDRFHLTDAHRIVCTLCHSDSAAPDSAYPQPAAPAATPTPDELKRPEKPPMKQQQQQASCLHVASV